MNRPTTTDANVTSGGPRTRGDEPETRARRVPVVPARAAMNRPCRTATRSYTIVHDAWRSITRGRRTRAGARIRHDGTSGPRSRAAAPGHAPRRGRELGHDLRRRDT